MNLEKKYYIDVYNERITKFKNEDTVELKVIGAMCLCNTASLNISYINPYSEFIIVSINNYKFEICDLETEFTKIEDDINYSFTFHGEKYYLNEFESYTS